MLYVRSLSRNTVIVNGYSRLRFNGTGKEVKKKKLEDTFGIDEGDYEDDMEEGVSMFQEEDDDDESFMKGVKVERQILELDEEDEGTEAEHQFFQENFLKKKASEPFDDAESKEEVRKKLGPDPFVTREEFEMLKEKEDDGADEDDDRFGKRSGKKDRRQLKQEYFENYERERSRQRRVSRDSDYQLRVGDVVVPDRWEKWVLDPTGDHRQRYKKQRLKEERIEKWLEEHGTFYEKKKKKRVEFKRDTMDRDVTVRQKRISFILLDAVARVVSDDLSGESGPQIIVQEVVVGGDLKRAVVYYSLDNTRMEFTEKEQQNVQRFLNKQNSRIRHLVTKRVKLKFSPELIFVKDEGLRKREEIQSALDQIEKELESMV